MGVDTTCEASDGCVGTSPEEAVKCHKCDNSKSVKTDKYKADFDISKTTDFGVCVETSTCGDGYFKYKTTVDICMKCSAEYKKCKSTDNTSTTIEADGDTDVCADGHELKDKKCV